MLLHRYFGSHAFETLKEAKLKTSRISDFNDPFEFMYVYTSSMTCEQAEKHIQSMTKSPKFISWAKQHLPLIPEVEIQNYLKQFTPEKIMDVAANFGKDCELSFKRRRVIIDEELRALCFSDSAKMDMLDEILLWSHYADKHKGVRIGFEFPALDNPAVQISEMVYQKNRVEVDFSFEAQAELVEYALFKSAITKSSAWEYEHEVRLFVKTESCEPREIKKSDSIVLEHFLVFDPACVKTVDFGALCSSQEIQITVSFLKANYPNTICRKADFHKTEYALEYKLI